MGFDGSSITGYQAIEESELVKKTLGEHAFPRFVVLKRKEWNNYRIQVTQYEFDNLVPIL